MGNYTIYHLHSDMSNGVTNIDSVTKYQSYIERAKECGMSALGLSEHGSVFAWDLKKEDIEKAGMKYAVALSCCTAALHLCVKSAGERLYGKPAISHGALEGRRVFCSDMTFDATGSSSLLIELSLLSVSTNSAIYFDILTLQYHSRERSSGVW